MEFYVKVNETCWTDSNEAEVNSLRTLFPEIVFRAEYKGIDLTAEYIATQRQRLIYG